MKHTIRYIALCLFSLCAFGMQAQRSFRVHKSDGNMQSSFYSSLDSITFSKTDLNGVSHDDVVVQEFHTTDSVYRIPLADIDSIAFTVPPTVYKPDAVKIEGQLRQYVVRADSLTLWLQGNTPENIIPKNGSNIVTLECDDVLPYGFVGKVRNVEKDGDCIKVDCAQASLFDVFEKVYIEVDAATGTEVGLKKSPSRTNAWPPESKEIKIETIGGKYDFEEEFQPSDDFSGEFNQSIGFELATPKFIVNTAILIDGMQFSYSMTTVGDHRFSLTGSVSGKVGYEKEIELASVRNLRIPGIASFIEFFASAGLYFNFDGNAALGAEYTRDYKSIIHYEYSNNSASSIPDRFTMKPGGKSIDVEFEGDARLSFGLSYGFGIAPIVKELASVETTMKHGVTFYLPEPVKLSLPVNKNQIDTLLYDKLNRDDYLCGNLDITGEMKITLLDVPNLPTIEFSKELDLDDYVRYNPVWKWGIVPEFKDVYLSIRNYEASAKVGRNLINSVKVGFAVYDKNNKLITTEWQNRPYYNQLDTTIRMEKRLVFPGNNSSEFRAYPVVEAFGIKMRANPYAVSSYPVAFTEAVSMTDSHIMFSGHVEGTDSEYPFEAGIAVYPFRELKASPNTEKFNFTIDKKEFHFYNEIYQYHSYYKEGRQYINGNTMYFYIPPTGYEPESSAYYDAESETLYFEPFGLRINFDVYEYGEFGNDRLDFDSSRGYSIKAQPGAVYFYRAVETTSYSDECYCGNFKRIFVPNNIGLSCEIISRELDGKDLYINGKLKGLNNYADYGIGYFDSIHDHFSLTRSVSNGRIIKEDGSFQFVVNLEDVMDFHIHDLTILIFDRNSKIIATFDAGSVTI